MTDVHDNRECPKDESGQDYELFPFVIKRQSKDKKKKRRTKRRDKKKPYEERPDRGQLLEDEATNANLVGGLCDVKETALPTVKNIKKHLKNLVKNAPDEGEL